MSTAKTDSTSGKAAAERLSGEEAHHKDRNTEGQPSGKAVSRPLPAGCSLRILTDFAEKQKTRPLYEEAFGDPEDFTDYYYADKCRDNTIVAVTDASGAVLSMAHLNPYTLSICCPDRRRRAPAAYLAAPCRPRDLHALGIRGDL